MRATTCAQQPPPPTRRVRISQRAAAPLPSCAHAPTRARAHVARLVEAVLHLSEDHVFVIQMRCRHGADEELPMPRAVGRREPFQYAAATKAAQKEKLTWQARPNTTARGLSSRAAPPMAPLRQLARRASSVRHTVRALALQGCGPGRARGGAPASRWCWAPSWPSRGCPAARAGRAGRRLSAQEGARARTCHGEGRCAVAAVLWRGAVCLVVLEDKVFVRELGAVNGAPARAVVPREVATLPAAAQATAAHRWSG